MEDINESKPVCPRFRLKENHPTYAKFLKLCNYAEDLGLSISILGYSTIVDDNERDKSLPTLYLIDADKGSEPMLDFPPTLEYHLVYENPEYIAYERKLEEREYE